MILSVLSTAFGAPFLTFDCSGLEAVTVDLAGVTYASGDPAGTAGGRTTYTIDGGVSGNGGTYTRMDIDAGTDTIVINSPANPGGVPLFSVDYAFSIGSDAFPTSALPNAPITVPIAAGNGVSRSFATCGDATISFDAGVSLADQAADLAVDAQAAYEAQFGAASGFPSSSMILSELTAILDDLELGACEADATAAEQTIVGWYDAGARAIGGDDSLGGGSAITGTLATSARTFALTLSDGRAVGTPVDIGVYGGDGRWYGDRSDPAGYAVGNWKRVRGKRGVFYGVTGSCNDGGDPAADLEGWYGADLTP